MTELKSCPFCGGKAETETYRKERTLFQREKMCIYIRCKDCGAETKAYSESPYYSAKEYAVTAWNRRVGENKALEKLEDKQ